MGQIFDFLIYLRQYARCKRAEPSDAESFHCPLRTYRAVGATGRLGEATERCPFWGGKNRNFRLLFNSLSTATTVASMLSTVVWERLQIVPARFSNEAGIIGNAALAADALAEQA